MCYLPEKKDIEIIGKRIKSMVMMRHTHMIKRKIFLSSE